uniref:Uncharacterized protein n=1 Tax=Anguilla anguilla TaxID=7936 RepID=A0A0E9WDG4_ANGAN
MCNKKRTCFMYGGKNATLDDASTSMFHSTFCFHANAKEGRCSTDLTVFRSRAGVLV